MGQVASYVGMAGIPVGNMPPELATAVAEAGASVSHNLNGQKLGRKGRQTRERIIAVALELLEPDATEPFSLPAVAAGASLGLTSLYNYFTDQTELLLAVLEPVMATAEESYLQPLRDRWPDEDLYDRCEAFVHAYHAFWSRHTRLLHLRNRLSDDSDERMFAQRVGASQKIIELLFRQMDIEDPDTGPAPLAPILMTGLERSITIITDAQLSDRLGIRLPVDRERYLAPAARLLELAIRDARDGF